MLLLLLTPSGCPLDMDLNLRYLLRRAQPCRALSTRARNARAAAAVLSARGWAAAGRVGARSCGRRGHQQQAHQLEHHRSGGSCGALQRERRPGASRCVLSSGAPGSGCSPPRWGISWFNSSSAVSGAPHAAGERAAGAAAWLDCEHTRSLANVRPLCCHWARRCLRLGHQVLLQGCQPRRRPLGLVHQQARPHAESGQHSG